MKHVAGVRKALLTILAVCVGVRIAAYYVAPAVNLLILILVVLTLWAYIWKKLFH